MQTKPNETAILYRIKCLEEPISKEREYLKREAKADRNGFRPLFDKNIRGGRELPPHKTSYIDIMMYMVMR
jgi:hypothetical protein